MRALSWPSLRAGNGGIKEVHRPKKNMPEKGSDSQRRNGRERRRRRRHLTDHLLVFGEGAPGSYQTHPPGQPRLLYAYPPGVPLPPSIATFCFPGGALPPAAQGSPIFSCNVVSSATRRVHNYVETKAGVNRSALAEAGRGWRPPCLDLESPSANPPGCFPQVHICCLAFREPPASGGGGDTLKCLCELSASDEIFRQRAYLYGLYRLYLSDAAARAAQPVSVEAEAGAMHTHMHTHMHTPCTRHAHAMHTRLRCAPRPKPKPRPCLRHRDREWDRAWTFQEQDWGRDWRRGSRRQR